jgi:hypothetical protein
VSSAERVQHAGQARALGRDREGDPERSGGLPCAAAGRLAGGDQFAVGGP